MENNYAVSICPCSAPKVISIPFGVDGLIESFKMVEKSNEIFTRGKKLEVSVMQLTDKAHLLYIEDGEKMNLVLNRTIGHIHLYGEALIINLDKYGELDAMTEIEAHHFCHVFDRMNIPIAML